MEPPANAHLTRKRDEMVFAQAGDVDVSDDDHFVMVLGENGIVYDICKAQRKRGWACLCLGTRERRYLTDAPRIRVSST